GDRVRDGAGGQAVRDIRLTITAKNATPRLTVPSTQPVVFVESQSDGSQATATLQAQSFDVTVDDYDNGNHFTYKLESCASGTFPSFAKITSGDTGCVAGTCFTPDALTSPGNVGTRQVAHVFFQPGPNDSGSYCVK